LDKQTLITGRSKSGKQ